MFCIVILVFLLTIYMFGTIYCNCHLKTLLFLILFFRFSALSTMWRLTLNTQSGTCWRQSTRKTRWRTSSRLDLKCTQGSCSACPRLTCPPRKRTLSRCTSFFAPWRRSSTSGSLTTGGTLSGIINRTLQASPGPVVTSCTISTWTSSTTLMSFFIRRIPNCSTEWTAISLYEFREQRVVSFFISFIQRAALSQWEFCEQKWCHFSSVSFKELHYLSGNFVNKSDVIFHHQDFRLFHLVSCPVSTWTLWTRLMSFFIRRIPNCSIEWAAISLYEFCEQRVVSFFIRRIPDCSTKWAALSQYEVCEQERCHFSSVSFKELHYLSGNFVNKSDVIFHQTDSRLFH